MNAGLVLGLILLLIIVYSIRYTNYWKDFDEEE